MDVHSPKNRSFNMSKIKGKDTKPEMLLRKRLWRNGYRYRLHGKNFSGKLDYQGWGGAGGFGELG